MTPTRRYVAELVKAWSAGRQAPPALPAGVAPAAVWDLLCAHNVEAALGSLLPAEARPDGAAAGIGASRERTRILLLECERILPRIVAAAGRAVLLKGAALALGTYPRPTDRWFLDLDVLVPRPAVPDVCRALAEIGYRPLRGARDPLYYDRHHLHRIMVGPQGAVVEIHWDLTLPRSVYRCDVEGVFARAETRPLGRLKAQCAAPQDLLLHGVYQHIADGFVDLRRVLDQVLIGRRLSEADWEEVAVSARKAGLDKALWLSLHVVKSIAGESAPAGTWAALAPAAATRRVLAGLDVDAACLGRRAERADGWTPFLHLMLTPTPRQQWQELGRALWIGEEQLLDRGHPADHLPGPGHRAVIGLGQAWNLLRASARGARALVTG